jgi:GT2 family glycosyltransferase
MAMGGGAETLSSPSTPSALSTPSRTMDLSISIVSWNTRDLLDQCLKSVFETTHGIEFEVIVVDNASSDGTVEMIRTNYPDVRVIANSGNAGFSRANNQAYEVSRGRRFMLLNPDTVCREDALAGLVRFLDQNPTVGAAGPLVLNANGTLQPSWARFPTLANEALGRLDRRIAGSEGCPETADETRSLGPFRVDWIGGCAMMVRRGCVQAIGPMDESLFMYCEETDWCLRLHKAGWEVWVVPSAEIMHIGGQSSMQVGDGASAQLRKSKVAFMRKHNGQLRGALLRAALGIRASAGLRRLRGLATTGRSKRETRAW